MQRNENRDRMNCEIQLPAVAGALPTNRSLKSIDGVWGDRNPFKIGDQGIHATHGGTVASAEPTTFHVKSNWRLSARALFPIGDQSAIETQAMIVPCEPSTNQMMKPGWLLSRARVFPEIGRHLGIEAHSASVSGVDRCIAATKISL